MALTYVRGDGKEGGKGQGVAQGGGKGARASRRGSRAPPGGLKDRPRSAGRSVRGQPAQGHQQQQHYHQQQQQQQRSSVRSKASSSTSNSSNNRTKKLKNCCRAFVELMFTQVGVGALVVLYTLMGASIFQYIETQVEDESIEMVENYRNETVKTMWQLTDRFNVLNRDQWVIKVNDLLKTHEEDLVKFIEVDGYDQSTVHERWTYPSSLMFSLSIITMIGYGDLVPRTEAGKIATIVYAVFGIPVYILYFMNMGKVFAAVLKWVYTKAYRWNVKRKWKQSANYDPMTNAGEDIELDEAYHYEISKNVIVPSTTCLYVMIFYLVLGTIMFAEWEGWSYLNSIYFCVTSLLKIGIGDFVPGAVFIHDESFEENTVDTQVKLVMNFVYLLVGMGIVAMCYYLLKEEVTEKAARVKTKVKAKLVALKAKVFSSSSPST